MTEINLSDIEISPQDVKERLDAGKTFVFVDVREQWEWETAHINGSVLIPMRDVPEHLGEWQDADEVVLYCHHGIRSLEAAAWLRAQGVDAARSMAGGIDRWSAEIDSSIPRY